MNLKKKFDTGKFIVLAETEPPKGVDISVMMEKAALLEQNVDACVVPDMNNAIMRMSSLAACVILQTKGMETIMQVCCRDRNRLALQADLLGAWGCGIENIMAVTGDSPDLGDHHQAKAVDDINIFELLEIIKKFHQGQDMAGIELQGSPEFLTGAEIIADIQNLDSQLQDMNNKIEAGAKFFITSPVFDIETLEPFLEKTKACNIKLIPTILLLKSLGMARYMERNVEYIHIPKELIKRLQKARDKSGECVKVASELVAQLKAQGFGGVLLSTMGQEDKIPQIL